MSVKINRREFLKLSSLLALSQVPLPSLPPQLTPAKIGAQPPNIVVLVFDALSASHMPVYGYPRNTTPNLDRFSQRANVYHNHRSAGNFTTPGTSSILTGVYPWSHRAFNFHSTVLDSFANKSVFSLMPPQFYKMAYSHNLLATTLLVQFQQDIDDLMMPRELSLFDTEYSDLLFRNDYNVSSWSEEHILHVVNQRSGSLFLSLLYQLLQMNQEAISNAKLHRRFPKGLPDLISVYYILEDGINWLIKNLDTLPQPFLSYIHFLPPHDPYTPRKDFMGLFKDGYTAPVKPEHFFTEGVTQAILNQKRRSYDQFLAYADSEFGRLYDFLEGNKRLENTTLLFTSDHGELFERGMIGHGRQVLYEPVLQVPLMIAGPGQTQRQDIYTPTSCIDLMPTLLQIAGQPIPEWCEGQVLPGFTSSPDNDGRSIYAFEAKENSKFGPLTRFTMSMLKENYKLIYYRGYEGFNDIYELYDLSKDPEEMVDLYASQPSTAAELRVELNAKIDEINRAPVVADDDFDQRRI